MTNRSYELCEKIQDEKWASNDETKESKITAS